MRMRYKLSLILVIAIFFLMIFDLNVMAVKLPVIKGNSVYRDGDAASINFNANVEGTYYYKIVNTPTSLTKEEILESPITGETVAGKNTFNLSSIENGAKYVNIVSKDSYENYSNVLTIAMPYDVYYFDDFEGYAENTYPEFFNMRYNGGSVSSQKIITLNENKLFNAYGTFSKGLDERIQISPISTGYAVFETDVSASSLTSDWYFGGIVIGPNYDNDNRNICVQVNPNSKKFVSGENGSNHTSNILFEANKNYHVKMVLDVQNHKLDYYINNLKANDESINIPASYYTSLNWFGIYNGAGTVYYDNMKFYATNAVPISTHIVTFNTNGGSAVDTQIIISGGTITEPTEPTKENYTFGGWYLDEELETEFDFATPITVPITIYAKWNLIYAITPLAPINGIFEVDKAFAIQDESVHIGITPDYGYKVKSVKVNNSETGITKNTDTNYTFEMPDEDVEVTVEFELIPKNITIRDMINGDVISDKAVATPGETVTLIVTQVPGYKLKKISILDMYDEMPVTLNSNNTFIMPSYNVFISAEFSKISIGGGISTPSYKITVSECENGKISPSTINVTKNENKKFVITANEGYEIEDVLVDGKSIGAISTYTFKKVTKKHTIEAVFKKIEETPIVVETKEYKDVTEKDWYYDSVMYVTQKEIMEGVGSDLFNPTEKITRAMFVTVLYNLENKPEVQKNNSFKDVKDGIWYTNPIIWAKENNIVNGFEDGTFLPDENVTRQQIAVIMLNYINYKNVEKPINVQDLNFKDNNKISSWAKESVKVIKQMNIMQGKDGNIFDALEFTNRAEIATVIMNFCEK